MTPQQIPLPWKNSNFPFSFKDLPRVIPVSSVITCEGALKVLNSTNTSLIPLQILRKGIARNIKA